jgi:hypothetical protein
VTGVDGISPGLLLTCRTRASGFLRRHGGGSPHDTGVPVTDGCVASLGKKIAGTFDISWAAAGREHAAPLQVGYRGGELHLTSVTEFDCFGEVSFGLVVTTEHRLQAAAVIRHRASSRRPDEEHLVVEGREQI